MKATLFTTAFVNKVYLFLYKYWCSFSKTAVFSHLVTSLTKNGAEKSKANLKPVSCPHFNKAVSAVVFYGQSMTGQHERGREGTLEHQV